MSKLKMNTDAFIVETEKGWLLRCCLFEKDLYFDYYKRAIEFLNNGYPDITYTVFDIEDLKFYGVKL